MAHLTCTEIKNEVEAPQKVFNKDSKKRVFRFRQRTRVFERSDTQYLVKSKEIVMKEDKDHKDLITYYVKDWPERYLGRFQRWYVRRCEKDSIVKNKTFEDWSVVKFEDCIHHLKNWDHGLKKALLKDKLIDNTRNVLRRFKYQQKRQNQRSALHGSHPNMDEQIQDKDLNKLSHKMLKLIIDPKTCQNKYVRDDEGKDSKDSVQMTEQGDNGTNVSDLEVASETTSTANITLVDERPVDVASLHTTSEIYSRDVNNDIAENDWTLNSILTREYPLNSFEWKVGDSTDKRIIDEGVPKIITDDLNCMITRQLKFFSFLRAGAHIRVQLNGTKFHCGRLIVYFKPLTWSDDNEENFYGLTCWPHFFLDASVSNSGEIYIPFTHLLTYFSQEARTTFNDSINSLGSFVIRPYNDLRATESASQSLFGQVYFSLTDPIVHLPTYEISAFSYGNGYMQGLESFLKKGAGSLINSGLGLADKFTGGLVTGAGDAICNLLGVCDKPIDPVSAAPIVNRTISPLCHGAGLDRSVRLGLSPIAQTDTDPAVLGAVDGDFNLLTLCKIPSLLDQPEWNVTDAAGTKLFDMAVTPVYLSNPQYQKDGTGRYTNYSTTMLAYVSRGFCYWRGPLKIKIQVIGTQFHSGRLALVYDPHGNSKINLQDFSRNRSHNLVIMDIQEKQELVVELPYFAIRPWMRCDRLRSNANIYNISGIVNDAYLDSDITGMFRIFVLNALVRPENVTDKIQINVFFYAGDGFELSIPNSVAPLSVRKGPSGVQYPNETRYAYCLNGTESISKYATQIIGMYLIGKRLFDNGSISTGVNWYTPVKELETPDVVSYVYFGKKLGYAYGNLDDQTKKLISSLPNYQKVGKEQKDETLSKIVSMEPKIVNTYDNSMRTLVLCKDNNRGINDIQNTIGHCVSESMEEQSGAESYTTTRDNDGVSVTMTSGNKISSVAPKTLSENAMQIQTLLRRYYPLYISPVIQNVMDFTIITIPVSPSFIPNDEDHTIVSPINRRFEANNLAWLSRLYTYSRGSMRYKIIVNCDDAEIIVWHNPVDAKEFNVTSGFTPEHVVEQTSFASDLAITRVQQGLEVEVPFYSAFNQILHSHISNKKDLRSQVGTLYVAVRSISAKFSVSIFVSTGDDFFLNVLRAPPIIHEPYLDAYTDGTPSDLPVANYPELQRSTLHDSISLQIPGSALFNRWQEGKFINCEIPDYTQDFSYKELTRESQQMEEQMFSSFTKPIADISGMTEFKNTYYADVKPTVDKIGTLTHDMQDFLDEFKNHTLPQILGHAKLFHKDLNDSHDTIKEFLPKIEESMGHLNAFLITGKESQESMQSFFETGSEAASYLTWMLKTVLISSVWLNILELQKKFSWTHLLNIVCISCCLFETSATQIIQWLIAQCTKMYEDCRSKATNGIQEEQGFEEFLAENADEANLVLSAIATIIYCSLFGKLPTWDYIKKLIKETVSGEEQSLPEFLRSIHFSNLGFKAINTTFDFFQNWISKVIDWFLQRDGKDILLQKQFKEKAEEIERWIDEIAELEDEDFYHKALSDVDTHNRYYKLVDQSKKFTKWLMNEGVSKNVSSVIRDANKRLMDMVKRINEIRPGHGFRYSPFVVMLYGNSGCAKSNAMHKFTEMIRDELDIPYYHSVCTVPKTKEFLDGYEGQTIVEWDDMLQCPKQDEMVADFINWRSNADCIINKAKAEEKGMHFTSKAIVCSSNIDALNLNTIRDMNAFRNRFNLRFKCKLAPGITVEDMKTMPRDPDYAFMRLDAEVTVDEGARFETIHRDMTLQAAIQLAKEHFVQWDEKQNDLVLNYMNEHGSMRIPRGIIIEEHVIGDDEIEDLVLENAVADARDGVEVRAGRVDFGMLEQGVTYDVSRDSIILDDEEEEECELFEINFETLSEEDKASMFHAFKMKCNRVVKKSVRYWQILKTRLKRYAKDICDKAFQFYESHPTFVKAMGILSVFGAASYLIKTLWRNAPSTEESAYSAETPKIPTKIIRAEGNYQTEVGKVPSRLVKAEGTYQTDVTRVPNKIVRAEGIEEGTDDDQAVEMGRNKIHPLLAIIGWKSEDKQCILQCLAIGGKVILCPWHFFRRASEGDFFYFQRGDNKILVEYTAARMFRIRDKDAALYFVGSSFDSRKNILNCFISEKNLSQLGRKTSAVLVGTHIDGRLMEKSCDVTQGITEYSGKDVGAPILKQHGWHYDLNTLKGECGSVLILLARHLPPPSKIVGIHTAGFAHKKGGFSVLLTREMIDETLIKLVTKFGVQVTGMSLPPQVNQEEQAFNEKCKVIPEGAFSYYGVMDERYCPSQPQKTSLRPTPWQNEDKYVPKKPAMLQSNASVSPLRMALKKYGVLTQPFKLRHINAVKEDILNELAMLDGDLKAEVCDMETTLFGKDGVQHCCKIDMNTSPGWPYQCLPQHKGKKGKRYLFDEDNKTISDPLLKRNVDEREKLAKNGERFPSIWRDCMKDELRPREKVDEGKTRLFTIAPVDFTILVRKYFLSFEQMFYKNHGKFFSAVGINPESYEWTEAYNRLRAYGNKCMAGDFSGYDGTLMADLMAAIGDIIDEWYKIKGEVDPIATIVRRVLIDEMIHTYQLVLNCVYKTHQGNPSGNPLTVIINTICNAFYIRLAWLEIMEEKCPSLATLDAFHQNCIEESYGDDNRIVIKEKVLDIYNQVTVAECLAKHGIKYTDESKTGELVPYRELENTSFLKRSYRKDEEVGKEIILPIMDKDTIISLSQWYHDADCIEDQIRANMRAALDFAFFHGRSFYEEYRRDYADKMRNYNLKPICITYDEQLIRFLNMCYGDGEGNYIEKFIDLGF